jgi:YidC/Oxa1 family membrane protein insertase
MKQILKAIKYVVITFLVLMLLTSCQGDQKYTIAKQAVLGDGMEHGIFQGLVVYPIGILINWLTTYIGNAGFAMIITTIVIRGITLPLTIKGQMASREMQKLQPKIQAIQEKYRGRDDNISKQQQAIETQKIYAELGVSPFGSMLYPFLSLPLFMGVWRATSTLEIMKHNANFFGFDLGITPRDAIVNNGNYTYLILIILVAITQFLQFKLSNHLTKKRNANNPHSTYQPSAQQSAMEKQMGIMMYFFTAMMVFMSLSLISAMSVYLTISALISIGQAYYIDQKMQME